MSDIVETEGLARREVVTAFLRRAGRILLVRRSGRVGTYRGRWSAISGYLEDSTPLDQALREVREETGLAEGELRLRASCAPLEVPAPEIETCWVVHPFLFDVIGAPEVRLDWENTEPRWVKPGEVAALQTVPRLAEALAACLEEA